MNNQIPILGLSLPEDILSFILENKGSISLSLNGKEKAHSGALQIDKEALRFRFKKETASKFMLFCDSENNLTTDTSNPKANNNIQNWEKLGPIDGFLNIPKSNIEQIQKKKRKLDQKPKKQQPTKKTSRSSILSKPTETEKPLSDSDLEMDSDLMMLVESIDAEAKSNSQAVSDADPDLHSRKSTQPQKDSSPDNSTKSTETAQRSNILLSTKTPTPKRATGISNNPPAAYNKTLPLSQTKSYPAKQPPPSKPNLGARTAVNDSEIPVSKKRLGESIDSAPIRKFKPQTLGRHSSLTKSPAISPATPSHALKKLSQVNGAYLDKSKNISPYAQSPLNSQSYLDSNPQPNIKTPKLSGSQNSNKPKNSFAKVSDTVRENTPCLNKTGQTGLSLPLNRQSSETPKYLQVDEEKLYAKKPTLDTQNPKIDKASPKLEDDSKKILAEANNKKTESIAQKKYEQIKSHSPISEDADSEEDGEIFEDDLESPLEHEDRTELDYNEKSKIATGNKNSTLIERTPLGSQDRNFDDSSSLVPPSQSKRRSPHSNNFKPTNPENPENLKYSKLESDSDSKNRFSGSFYNKSSNTSKEKSCDDTAAVPKMNTPRNTENIFYASTEKPKRTEQLLKSARTKHDFEVKGNISAFGQKNTTKPLSPTDLLKTNNANQFEQRTKKKGNETPQNDSSQAFENQDLRIHVSHSDAYMKLKDNPKSQMEYIHKVNDEYQALYSKLESMREKRIGLISKFVADWNNAFESFQIEIKALLGSKTGETKLDKVFKNENKLFFSKKFKPDSSFMVFGCKRGQNVLEKWDSILEKSEFVDYGMIGQNYKLKGNYYDYVPLKIDFLKNSEYEDLELYIARDSKGDMYLCGYKAGLELGGLQTRQDGRNRTSEEQDSFKSNGKICDSTDKEILDDHQKTNYSGNPGNPGNSGDPGDPGGLMVGVPVVYRILLSSEMKM
ncbi:hypothetical protein BB560_002416, partial [Smittium megazygosporum]